MAILRMAILNLIVNLVVNLIVNLIVSLIVNLIVNLFENLVVEEKLKLVHPLSDKVFERRGSCQVKSFSEQFSNQVLPH